METCFQRTCQIHQMPRPLHIDAAVFFQNSKHYAIRPQLLAREHVMLHGFEVVRPIAEIPAAWPYHHTDWNGHSAADGRDKTRAAGGATLDEPAAQFDPM